MADWQPIETAPTDTPVILGGWAPDRMSMGMYRNGVSAADLVWEQYPGFAFTLNERAIRIRKCDVFVRWWKPINLNPPAEETSA